MRAGYDGNLTAPATVRDQVGDQAVYWRLREVGGCRCRAVVVWLLGRRRPAEGRVVRTFVSAGVLAVSALTLVAAAVPGAALSAKLT